MKLKAPLWLCVALPLWLGGCLLPQPDTPPIGPPGKESAARPQQPGNGVSQGASTATAPTSDVRASATPAASAEPAATDAAASDAAGTPAATPKPSPTPAS